MPNIFSRSPFNLGSAARADSAGSAPASSPTREAPVARGGVVEVAPPSLYSAAIDQLAPPARAKIEALELEAAAQRAASLAIGDELGELRTEKRAADDQLHAYESHPFRSKEDDDRLLPAYRARVARVRRAMERQEQARADRQARWGDLNGLFRALIAYVDENAQAIRPYEGKVGAPGGDPRKVVDQARRHLEEFRADRRQIAAAPIPAAEAKRRIVEQVKALAERGRPNVAPVIERYDDVRFARARLDTFAVAGVQTPPTPVVGPDTLALFAWMNQDALIAALHAEVDELADDKAALSDDDRNARLAELDAEILATERAEEAAVEAATDRGIAIDRRRDADPRAVLGLADDMPAPKEV